MRGHGAPCLFRKHHRADKQQARHLLRAPAHEAAGEVAAVGIAGQQEGTPDCPVHERQEQVEHLVGVGRTVAGGGGSPAHARQVRVDALVARAPCEDGLQAAGHDPVV
ncbi:MAG TPA: hypothetical protein VD969_00415 [Symbiobacteriaceae bacterium]|nr:hypothetical protein [Symbiobacteriaceae bacterium]